MALPSTHLRFYLTGGTILVVLTVGFLGVVFQKAPATPLTTLPASIQINPATAEQWSQTLLANPSSNTVQNANKALAAAQQALTAQPLVPPPQSSMQPGANTWDFASNNDATIKPSLPLSEHVKNYGVVKINPNPEVFPVAGDRLTLPMFNGRTLTANVETVNTLANGDKVWTGHLEGYGEDFPVVMTYGETLTFATIHTPEGSYSLEAKEGVGWLYKNPSIVELAGANYVDALVPHE